MKTIAKIAATTATLCVLMTALALEANAQQQATTYTMTVKTGTRSGAGTDSNIYVVLYGSKGKTREIRLNGYIKRDAFENGQRDTLQFAAEDVGNVQSMLVRSDNKFFGAAWDLDSIAVTKKGSVKKTAYFKRWIETGMLSATAPLK